MDMLKCDLHIHTHYSPDSNMKPESVIKVALEKGLDVIGVVDHDIYKGGPEIKKLAERTYPELIVIPGEEIKTLSGEIIAYNLKETIPKKLSLEKTIEEARKQGAFITVPHPFDKIRQGVGNSIELIKDKVDAIEAFNARSMYPGCNKKALEYAKKNNIPVVAGSDSHFLYEISSGFMKVDSEPNIESIIKAILDGRVSLGGKKTGIKPHIGTFFEKKNFKIKPFT